ncbi:uncharacterized protein LOC110017831 [Phalaenopsis equestris]|uniref:uncharacterized protein LOC110017831 n=1 Tax=Phalaenopsis equestris TaxID=78828 RepID=UPI0009E2C576|nr:uncharacterized protein LOC110017831 [Phalaenopsis equestris]
MMKLYNGLGKKIHPSPPPSSPCDLLSVLPAAILTLTAALSPEDKEVLAYLLCGPIAGKKNNQHHPPELGCDCFGCYKSFWARWDASPNRYLIHQILEAVEESVEPLAVPSDRGCHHRRSRFNSHKDFKEEFFAAEEDGKDEGFEEEDCIESEEREGEAVPGVNSSGTVRRFISFIGDRIWGVWNQ